jgi:cell division protein FtsL
VSKWQVNISQGKKKKKNEFHIIIISQNILCIYLMFMQSYLMVILLCLTAIYGKYQTKKLVASLESILKENSLHNEKFHIETTYVCLFFFV